MFKALLKKNIAKTKEIGIFNFFKSILLENKSDNQTIFKNTFWLFLSEGVNKVLMFILTIFIARHLGLEGYGKFAFALSIASLFGILADFGLSTLSIREIARKRKLAAKYVGNITSLKVILGLITLLLLVVSSIFLQVDFETKILVYMFGVYIVLNSFGETFKSAIRAFERMEIEAVIKIIRGLVLFILGISFLLFQKSSVCIVGVYCFGSFIALILSVIFAKRKVIKNNKRIKISIKEEYFDFKFWKIILKKGWPFGLTAIFYLVYFKIDQVMLGLLSDSVQVGSYSAAYDIYVGAFAFPHMIIMAFFPKLSNAFESNKKKLKEFYRTFRNTFIVIGAVGFSFLLPLSQYIIIIIYGEKFISSIPILKVLSFILLFRFCTGVYGWMLTSCNYQEKKILFQGICAGINIVLNYILIMKYQAIGAAYATLITEFVLLLLYYTYYKYKTKDIYNEVSMI